MIIDERPQVLRRSVDSCLDALVETAFQDRGRAGWLSWELDVDGRPVQMRAGRASLYDGDAGTAWACAELGVALGRSDLIELAVHAGAFAVSRAPSLPAGLLAGRAGVLTAARLIERCTAEKLPGIDQLVLPAPEQCPAADLTDGLAGLMLAGLTTSASLEAQSLALAGLEQTAHRSSAGCCWPQLLADPVEGRPLSGLAHGNSGIALALAEVAIQHPVLHERAAALAADALRWERAWFDPTRGRWPDLRGEPPSFPALWCHGAAGIAITRLGLLQLVDAGLRLPISVETLQAEAELAVMASAQDLASVIRRAKEHGSAELSGGLSLCHGLGGQLEVLLLASQVWGVHDHLKAAQTFAVQILELLGPEPLQWPAGLPASGSCSLFLGLAGAAQILARLAYPDRLVASPSTPWASGPIG